MLSDRCLSCLSGLSVCPVCDVGALWPNDWMDQDGTWHAGRPRPWSHCVRWGPSSPSPKGQSHQFLAHICCCQMAGWIKMVLGMEVGLNPGDFVLDGYQPLSLKRGGEPFPVFGPFLLWPNRWMHQDATWYGGRSQPRDFVLDRDPAPSSTLPKKGGGAPKIRHMSIAVKRLHGSKCHLVRRQASAQTTLR